MGSRLLFFVLLAFAPIANLRAEGARPSVQGTTLVAPLVVDGTQYSSAWIFPNSRRDTFFVEAEPLLELLKEFLSEERLAEIRLLITDKRVIALASLDQKEIHANFDEKSLDLNVEIPGGLRKRSSITLTNSTHPDYRRVAESSFYSGYLNARASQAYIYPHLDTQKTRQPLASNLELVNNIGGLVLDTGADYTEKNNPLWRRADSRAIVDSESKMLRITAGDLQFPFTGYQNSVAMGGLSVTRQFSIQPYTVTRPINATEIFLRRPSTIEVYVNGIYTTKLHMPAGPLDVRDFPLASGLNNVEVKITDDMGKVENIQLSMLYDAQLLREGFHQYTYNVGAPSTATDRDRIYDSHNMTGSFYHRYGWNNDMTLGLNFQSNRGERLAGFEQTWMNGIGIFQTEIASFWSKGSRESWAARNRFHSLEYRRGQLQLTRYSLDSEYKSERFAGLNTSNISNPYAWSFDAYAVRSLPWQLNTGLGYKYQISRTEDPNRREWRADISKNWSSNWRTGINYSNSRGPLSEQRFFVTITWTEQSGRYYANGIYDYPAKLKRVEMTRNPIAPYNDLRISAGAQSAPESKQGDLQAEYIAERFTTRIDHESLSPTDATSYNRSTLSIATALAWTDSAIALSRPISESFVILPTKSQLKKFNIPINNNGEYPEAEASWWGPAVLPGVISYNMIPISVDGSSLPIGYSVGHEFWAAKPRYKSGVTILIGGEASLIAVGSLKLKDGKDLALASGEVYDLKGNAQGNSFFTNRMGQYMIENLKPGSYELRFFDPQYKPVTLNVSGQLGIVRVAPIQVERQQD